MQKVGKLIQYMRQTRSMNWGIQCLVWVCSVVSCHDFKDCRTPYKNRVSIVLISKKTPSKPPLRLSEIILPPDEDQTRLYINIQDIHNGKVYNALPSTDSSHKEIIAVYYQKEAVLISPQCGCAYKYRIEKVTSKKGEVKIINKTLSQRNDSNFDIQICYP